MDALNLAEKLLDAVRQSKPQAELEKKLWDLDLSELHRELNHDSKRKAFWINIYNAYAQELLGDKVSYWAWFKALNKRSIGIAGRKLNLQQIEHGILRRSRVWWAFGHLKKIWTSRFERDFRVDTLDPRIHFALNCAAHSCPPIRFYQADEIESQLDLATVAYLEAEIELRGDEIFLPGIFPLFPGDFGSRKGILLFVSKHLESSPLGESFHQALENKQPVRFLKFDRTLKPYNFS